MDFTGTSQQGRVCVTVRPPPSCLDHRTRDCRLDWAWTISPHDWTQSTILSADFLTGWGKFASAILERAQIPGLVWSNYDGWWEGASRTGNSIDTTLCRVTPVIPHGFVFREECIIGGGGERNLRERACQAAPFFPQAGPSRTRSAYRTGPGRVSHPLLSEEVSRT